MYSLISQNFPFSQSLPSSCFTFFYSGKYCFLLLFFFSFNPLFLAVSDYVLEEEAQDYVNSIHIEDDPVDKYSLPEQQLQVDYETEIVVEETPVEETSTSFQSMVDTVHEAPAPVVEEPVGDAPRKSYAAIVCSSSFTSVCVCWLLGDLFTQFEGLGIIDGKRPFSEK